MKSREITMLSSLRRMLIAAFVLVLMVPVSGCDLFSSDSDSVDGTWKSRGDDVIFLVFKGDKITEYDYMGDSFDDIEDCYLIGVLDIVKRDGDRYTITAEGEADIQIVVTIKRSGDTITFSFAGDSETYDKSDRSAASFTPRCDWDTKRSTPSLLDRLRAAG